MSSLPALLSRKSLVEENEHFGDIELNILQVQIFLVILLHLQQVVKLQI
jgi:hypothetical protein